MVDNGPVLTPVRHSVRAEMHGVEFDFKQPGKPVQNRFLVRFERNFREEALNIYALNPWTVVA